MLNDYLLNISLWLYLVLFPSLLLGDNHLDYIHEKK